jgi:hypothetical protein
MDGDCPETLLEYIAVVRPKILSKQTNDPPT